MEFIDCHCHLEMPLYDGHLDGVLARCQQNGLKYAISALGDYSRLSMAWRIAKANPFVKLAVGLDHDFLDGNWRQKADALKPLMEGAVAVGEIGLDHHHYKSPQEWALQEEAFLYQVELAEKLGLPVQVHSRKAEDRVFELLGDYPGVRVMLHCFLVKRLASEAKKRGYVVSLPTVKSDARLKIARDNPMVVCETDSPFLNPTGDGLNEPWRVRESYEAVANARGVSLEEACSQVNAVAGKLFGLEM